MPQGEAQRQAKCAPPPSLRARRYPTRREDRVACQFGDEPAVIGRSNPVHEIASPRALDQVGHRAQCAAAVAKERQGPPGELMPFGSSAILGSFVASEAGCARRFPRNDPFLTLQPRILRT